MLVAQDEFTVDYAIEQYKELKKRKVGFPWFFKKVYGRGEDFIEDFNNACEQEGLPPVRTNVKTTIKYDIGELVEEYQSLIDTKKPFPWFYSKFHALPAESQLEFNERCESLDLPTIDRRISLRWTDEEWHKIAQGIVAGLAVNPTSSVIEIARSVVEEFPESRQKRLRFSSDIRKAVDIASKIMSNMIKNPQADEMTVQQLINAHGFRLSKELSDGDILAHFKDRVLNAMKKEDIAESFVGEVLEVVTPEEVLQHIPAEIFASHEQVQEAWKKSTSDQDIDRFINTVGIERIMSRLPATHLAAYGATEMVKWWQAFSELILEQSTKQNVEAYVATPQNGDTKRQKTTKAKKVAVYGLLSGQAESLKKRLGSDYKIHLGLESGVRTPASIPGDYDLHLLWSRFVSHAADNQVANKAGGRLIRHFGGINEMATKIKDYFESK